MPKHLQKFIVCLTTEATFTYYAESKAQAEMNVLQIARATEAREVNGETVFSKHTCDVMHGDYPMEVGEG